MPVFNRPVSSDTRPRAAVLNQQTRELTIADLLLILDRRSGPRSVSDCDNSFREPLLFAFAS